MVIQMMPKINKATLIGDFKINVSFDDGKVVVYDLMSDIEGTPHFHLLKEQNGLLEQMKVERYRICWNDLVDLPSDILYEYGETIQGE